MADVVKVLGVIIAGGESRRFNQDASQKNDKFMAPFGDGTLLGHIIDRAKIQIPDLALNANGDLSRLETFGLEMISDDLIDKGPLGGMLSAMIWAKGRDFSHIVTFSSDSPFFPDDYVARLVEAVTSNDIRVAISQSGGDAARPHPVMGIFDLSLRDDLKVYIESGERRVMWWIMRHPHLKVVWDDCNPDPFFNINRPEDLEKAAQYLTQKYSEL